MPNCPEKDTCLGMSLAGPQALLNGQCKVDTDECSAECQSMISLPCDTCKAGDTVDYTLGRLLATLVLVPLSFTAFVHDRH